MARRRAADSGEIPEDEDQTAADQEGVERPEPLKAGKGERLGTVVNQCEDQVTCSWDKAEGQEQAPPSRTFFVTRDAEVTLDGKAVSVKDLVPGDRVKIAEDAPERLDKVEAERPERIRKRLAATH